MTSQQIEIREPDGGTKRYTISNGSTLSLGRDSDADIALDHATVSRRHGALRVVEGRLEVRDLASRHGTFVDDRRVDGWTEIPTGQSAWLGDFEVVALGAPVTPAIVTVHGRTGGVASYTLTGEDEDELGRRELPSGSFPDVAELLPLRFGRVDGSVAWVEDAAGTRVPFEDHRARIAGGTIVIADKESEGALASVVAPRPDRTVSTDAPAVPPTGSGQRRPAAVPTSEPRMRHVEGRPPADDGARDIETTTGSERRLLVAAAVAATGTLVGVICVAWWLLH